MRRPSLPRCFTALFTALHLLLPSAAAAQSLALTGATLLDGTGEPPVKNAVVVIADGRITAAGPADSTPVPAGAEQVDLAGKWVIPGLVDSHIHFFQSGGLYTRPDIIDRRATRSYEEEQAGIRRRLDSTFRRYLAAGVTAVVDMGGPFWNFTVREQAAQAPDAPAVAVTGPLISTVSRPRLDLGDPPIIRADSPDDARKLVRAQLKREPDFIKIWYILPPSGDPEENLDIVEAALDEAHKARRRVAVHATQLETARAAVEAGADILVHSVDDAPLDEDLLEEMTQRGVIYIPTLMVYEGYAEVLSGHPDLTAVERELGDPAAIRSFGELPETGADAADDAAREARVAKLRTRLPVMLENLRRAHAAGVTVAAGTDAGNIGTLHGPALHREFELMARAGLAPADILVTATRNAARVFAPKPDFGTLTPGQRASLVVLEADPLADVRNWRRIAKVYHRGTWHTPDGLIPPTPETVVQRQVEAYNARDLEAFLAFYHPEVTITRLPAGEVTASGTDAMRVTYKAFFEQNPDLHCRIMQRTVSGAFVVDHEFVTGVKKRPRLRAVAVYEVEDGLIRRVWFLPKEQ